MRHTRDAPIKQLELILTVSIPLHTQKNDLQDHGIRIKRGNAAHERMQLWQVLIKTKQLALLAVSSSDFWDRILMYYKVNFPT